jgi:hypothetical protein
VHDEIQDDEIQVKLEGTHGTIDPRAVAEAIVALDKILRHIASDEPPRLELTGLSVGSAKISIRSDQQRVETVLGGVDSLAASPVIPKGWSAESITGLVELEHVSARRGVDEVLLRTRQVVATIDDELARHAEACIALSPPSLGAVRGTLYRYNNNGDRRVAGMRDYRTGHAVEVLFPGHLVADVRSALDHEVEAWGEVRRDMNDRIRSITITGIETIQSSRAAVTLDDVAGIFGADWTDGLDPVEWVRHQRD